MNKKLLVVICLLSLWSCTSESGLEGLWIVQKVRMGEQEVTPNARWTRFHGDFSQQSGNGWFQHSYGSWTFEEESRELSIVNVNGLTDSNGPFQVQLEGDRMTWTREEEGQQIVVSLERATELPATYGDQVMGLWKLENAVGTHAPFDSSQQQTNSLFLRWDKRFDIRSAGGRVRGVYNVHGHKPEIEFIPYGDKWERSFWKIDFSQDRLSLELLNGEEVVKREFVRVYEFPN
ncbi:MAG: hypothetical protein AAFV95_14745 [Bacteroidota bacterium]